MFFSRFAKSVTLLVRGPDLAASMCYYLIQQLASIEKVSVRVCTVVDEVHGDDHLDGLTLRHIPSVRPSGWTPATCSSSSARSREPIGCKEFSSATIAGSC